MDDVNAMPWYLWPIVAAILLSQAIWIYLDAGRRGERKFLWGLFGLLSCPSSLLVYLLVTRVLVKTRPCQACGGRVGVDARFCPRCGTPQGKSAPPSP